eukprot:394322_1
MELDLSITLGIVVITMTILWFQLPNKAANNKNEDSDKLAKLIQKYDNYNRRDFDLRAHFIKDYRLFAPVIFDDYLFEKAMKAKNKWNEWLLYHQTANNQKYFNKPQDFIAYKKKLIHKVCQHINNKINNIKEETKQNITQEKTEENTDEKEQKHTLKYEMECVRKGFLNLMISNKNTKLNEDAYYMKIFDEKMNNIKKNKLGHCYNNDNVNKILCSIDLRSAHMQCTMYLDKRILNGYDKWEYFMSEFTEYELFQKSKAMRLHILGKTIPKIQSKITNYFIEILINKLKEKNKIDLIDENDSNLYVNHDEVIIRLNQNDEKIREKQIKRIENDVNELLEYFKCRVEVFYLKKVCNNKKWYLKDFLNGKKEIKCVDSKFFMQVYQHIFEPHQAKDIRHRVVFQSGDVVLVRDIFK